MLSVQVFFQNSKKSKINGMTFGLYWVTSVSPSSYRKEKIQKTPEESLKSLTNLSPLYN